MQVVNNEWLVTGLRHTNSTKSALFVNIVPLITFNYYVGLNRFNNYYYTSLNKYEIALTVIFTPICKKIFSLVLF